MCVQEVAACNDTHRPHCVISLHDYEAAYGFAHHVVRRVAECVVSEHDGGVTLYHLSNGLRIGLSPQKVTTGYDADDRAVAADDGKPLVRRSARAGLKPLTYVFQ